MLVLEEEEVQDMEHLSAGETFINLILESRMLMSLEVKPVCGLKQVMPKIWIKRFG